jgi:hypothetical protein
LWEHELYFEITNRAESVLPVTDKIYDGVWLHRQTAQLNYGYCLGQHGGNFINFDIQLPRLDISFGFYKDFVLTQDPGQGILLSNIQPSLTPLPGSVIAAHVSESGIKFAHRKLDSVFTKKSHLSLQQVAHTVRALLIENLKTIQQQAPLLIAYSGGLDSGTLAWLAHSEGLKFTAVVDPEYNLPVDLLPFDWVYSSLTHGPDLPAHAWSANTVSHFYHEDINQCVGGFYGDLALLHHRDLFGQSQQLTSTCFAHTEHYDTAPDSQLTPFQTHNAMLASIVKLHLAPQFRQWFDNFEIFDAYRDPRLFEVVLQLGIDDLLLQFKTAYIQKYLVGQIDQQCWKVLCDYKNDYTKF